MLEPSYVDRKTGLRVVHCSAAWPAIILTGAAPIAMHARSRCFCAEHAGRCCRDVVVLAEADKEWMDGEMKAALKGYNIQWQTRQGSPYAAADLQRVSAGASSMIVLMRPEEGKVQPACSSSSCLLLHAAPAASVRVLQVLWHVDGKHAVTWARCFALALPTCLKGSVPSSSAAEASLPPTLQDALHPACFYFIYNVHVYKP